MGECDLLLKDARRMEGASKRAEQLMQNALAATQAAKVMLKHAETMAKDLFKNEHNRDLGDGVHLGRISNFGDDDVSKTYDMQARMLWGPWDHGSAPYENYHRPREDGWLPADQTDNTSSITTRVMEREKLDQRAVEYLNLVEGQTLGPSTFSAAAAASITAAGMCRQPLARRLRRRAPRA